MSKAAVIGALTLTTAAGTAVPSSAAGVGRTPTPTYSTAALRHSLVRVVAHGESLRQLERKHGWGTLDAQLVAMQVKYSLYPGVTWTTDTALHGPVTIIAVRRAGR